MIAAVHFKNFKALRSATVKLEPFNLFIGPNGSGKTSLIQALLRLRTLSALATGPARELKDQRPGGPQMEFHFRPPFQDIRVTLGCSPDQLVCNLLAVDLPPGPGGAEQWGKLRLRLQTIRGYLFDHRVMAEPALRADASELDANANNLAAVLAQRREKSPAAMELLEIEFRRIMPEFSGLEFRAAGTERVELLARLSSGSELVATESLSEGTLHLLAILALAYAPEPPGVVCLEEADRGVHPRMLREVRDALYRLSYPQDCGESRPPVQVITTTHSPYLLDLFREHPEEIVFANKLGNAATFERLADRADIIELMKDTNLGDLWYSGILGGVPGE